MINLKLNEVIKKFYLHMHKHISVKIIIITAATDAPTATAITSPSISQ